MPEPLIFKFEGNLTAEMAERLKVRLKAEVGDRPVVLIDRWVSVVYGDVEGAAERARAAFHDHHDISGITNWRELDEGTRELWRNVVRAVYGDG